MSEANISRSYPIVSREAGAIPADAVVLKLWGDAQSGQVNDLIYVSNEKIHAMVFSLPPGGRFRHSDRSRTYFGADELYFVISGTLLLANPGTGEVHRIEQGQAAYFGPDVWHHGFNPGTDELRVFEFFAPPPATGTSQVYARTKPYLSTAAYVQDQWLKRWPEAIKQAREKYTQRVIGRDEILWRIEGAEDQIPVGIYLSTERLTVGYAEILPGQKSSPHIHGGDEAGYVLEGQLNLYFPGHSVQGRGNGWFRMQEGDGFFIPEGEIHQYFNISDHTVRFIFGVAPAYTAEAELREAEERNVN